MLAGDRLRNLLSRGIMSLYEPATMQVRTRSTTRDSSTGEFPYTLGSAINIRVQRDICTHRQTQAEGYVAGDVRFMIAQASSSTKPSLDGIITYRNEKYELFPPLDEDPARVYWEVRGRRLP